MQANPMNTVQRIRVALNLKKNNIPLVLVLARFILACMTANAALFTACAALLTTLAAQIAALAGAQLQVKNRAVGATGARDAARNVLLLTLESLRHQVQVCCDTTPDQAIALIQAAGMRVFASTGHTLALLTARIGAQPGVVNLVASARLLSTSQKKKTYNWEVSVNGGLSWTAGPSTPYARTTFEGLPSLTVCSFRVNVSVGSAGPGAWTQAVSIVVH